MKIDDLRKSDNVEDRRSSSGGSFSSGGSGLPILQLLLMRGSWKTKLVVLIILLLLGGGGLTSIFNDSSSPSSYQSQNVSRSVDNSATREQIDFVNKVLGSTEDFWFLIISKPKVLEIIRNQNLFFTPIQFKQVVV